MDTALSEAKKIQAPGEGLGLAVMNAADARLKKRGKQRNYEEQVGVFASVDFTPRGAVEWLQRKAFEAAGLLSEHLAADVKAVLVDALREGDAQEVVQAAIAEAFAPYLLSGEQDELLSGPRLATIIRTNNTAAYNHGRMAEFTRPDLLPFLEGVRYSAVLDERTTPVCQFLHEKVFRPQDPALEDLLPPNHFNCRSVVVPITVGEAIPDDAWATPADVQWAKDLADQEFLDNK